MTRIKSLTTNVFRDGPSLLFVAILLIAAFLRVYRLDQLPPGLHYDEAFNATMAQRVLSGEERPLIFREDLTEEPMAIYTAALVFALIGESPYSLRLTSALAGIMGVAALYALARALFQSRGIAALAALTLAVLYPHVNFSRLGMEPIFAPLMMTLCLTFLWRVLRSDMWQVAGDTGRIRGQGASDGGRIKGHLSLFLSLVTCHMSLAGLFLAATQYTYKAALFFPGVVVAFLITEILADRTVLSRLSRPFALFALVAFLAFAPLGLYFVAHPSEFLERPGSVIVGASALAENAVKVGGMFFLRGDANPRSNLPDRPALDPFLAIGFVVGLISCIANWKRSDARLLLIWLGVMILPSIVTDYAPHFGRSIGATPAIALIVAWGFQVLIKQAAGSKQQAVWLLPAVYCLLSAGFIFTAYSTYRDYFDIWGARSGNFDSFDVGLLQTAQKLRDRPADERIYLSPTESDHYTIRFGLGGRAGASFDGRRVLVLPPPNVTATYGIITRDDARTVTRLSQIYPNGAMVGRVFDYTAQPYATIFRAAGAPQIAPQNRVDARFGDAIELIGYDLTREPAAVIVTLYWRSVAETRADYTVFVHLTDAALWAQADARPGHGSYPTPKWRAGEWIVDDYRLALTALPRGAYAIEIGMYVLETGARVRVTDARGARMEEDRVILDRLSVP